MKKNLAAIICLFLLITGCKKTSQLEISSNPDVQAPTAGRLCATQEVLARQLQEDPFLADRMNQIEAYLEYAQRNLGARLVNGTYEIPVVVNVLYNTNAQNITDAQIQSQITVLNKDFGGTNSDYNQVPSLFQSVRAGDTKIHFVLSQIFRKQTSKSSWTTNDAMKQTKRGGIDPTDPTTKLNMWCCNMGGGILGYAQFPGGKASTDGVVMDDNAFGSTGTAKAPYGLGRTATHEIGHWLNLRHIWGDASCGNDLVDDTPPAQTANYGCPNFPHTTNCNSTAEMTMNYMDYTDDACMYMFSALQKTRMLATFTGNGGRTSFAQP